MAAASRTALPHFCGPVLRKALLLPVALLLGASLVAGARAGGGEPKVSATVRVGGFPNALAVGSGAVWVVGGGRSGGFLAVIDPRTNRLAARVPAPVGSERACGVAAGFGAAWAVAGQPQGLLRVDSRVRTLDVAIPVAGATCLAAGFGSLWVTSAERGTVTRIDPRTRRRIGQPIRAGRYPEGVAAGFGSVWVASGQRPCGGRRRPCTPGRDESGELARIDPRTHRVLARLRIAHSPSYVAVAAGGVWLSSNDGTIVRVDPRSHRVGPRIDVTGGGRTSLAAGFGLLWVDSIQGPGGRGRIWPVEPRTGVVGQPVVVGESPVGIAASAASIWVANFNDGTISRIVP